MLICVRMKPSRTKDLKRFFEPIKWNVGKFSLISLRSLQNGVQWTIVAIAMQQMLDSIGSGGNTKVALTWLLVMAILFLLGDLPSAAFRRITNRMGRNIESSLYQQYIGKYIVGDNNKFESLGTWRISNVIGKGITSWVNILTNIPNDFVKLAVGVIAWLIIVGLNLWIKWFLIFIAIFGLSFIFIQFANKKLALLRKERREVYTEQDRNTTRLIMSKFEVLQNNKFPYEKGKIASFYEMLFTLWKRESKKMILTFDLQRVTFTFLRIWLIYYVITHIGKGGFSIGDLALFWMMFNQIYGNIMDLNFYVTNAHQQVIYIRKLWDTFDEIPALAGYDVGKEFKLKTGHIEINNITYSYGKWDVLEDFSLSIEGWAKTAFVGISGSGKSTLIKLIAGYIHPQDGEVIIDGQALPNTRSKNHVSLKSYYQQVGYLTQEPNIFDGTIYENLTYALVEKPSQEQIDAAIQWSQCQFIYEFPEGVQTEIGEKGIKLSGGQRQRLAIAKVMLKNPQIILLDEPTSALDSFSEEEVTKAFNNLFQWRTVIIIAHRLQTVKKADRIIVLDHGKIVEEWNHDSLVKSGGVYAKMLELQSGF